jgi:hypothetical protein
VNAQVRWLVSAVSGSEEFLAVASGSQGNMGLDVLRRVGANFATEVTVATQPDPAKRGFDLAMEGSSGNALLVYADGSNRPRYRERTSAGWSADRSVFGAAPGSGTVKWVQLAASPRSDEITLLYADSGSNLFAAVWSGAAWTLASPSPLDTNLNTPDFQDFIGAYESVSGDLMVAWGTGPDLLSLYWSAKPAGQTVFAPRTNDRQLNKPGPMSIASEPGSDRIALAYVEHTCVDGCDDFAAAIWNGTSLTQQKTLNPDVVTLYGQRPGSMPVGVSWVGTTGEAIAVYAHGGSGVSWARFRNSSGWVLQSDAVTNPALPEKADFALLSIPSRGAVLVLVEDVSGALWGKLWQGTSWLDTEGGAPLATGLQAGSSPLFTAFVR